MKRRFTDDDIIRFLYDEMSLTESEMFLTTLCSDESLWERYEYFQKVVEQIGQLKYSPSDYSVNKVMNYVRETTPENPVEKPSAKRRPLWKRIPYDLPLKSVAAVALMLFMTVAITGSIYTVDRGGVIFPRNEGLVQQVDFEFNPLYKWDDSELDVQLEEIRLQVANLEDNQIM